MTEQIPQSHLSPTEVETMLAMATTGELGHDHRYPAVDLSQLTAPEIFNAIHAVKEAANRIPTRVDDPRHADVDPQDRRLVQYQSDLDDAVNELPRLVGPEKTIGVFRRLVESPSAEDRRFAGAYIGVLTQVEHDYGVELWKRLLVDDHPGVAEAAWYSTEPFLSDKTKPEDAVRSLSQDGLAWTDLTELIDTYVRHLEQLRRDHSDLPDNSAW